MHGNWIYTADALHVLFIVSNEKKIKIFLTFPPAEWFIVTFLLFVRFGGFCVTYTMISDTDKNGINCNNDVDWKCIYVGKRSETASLLPETICPLIQIV